VRSTGLLDDDDQPLSAPPTLALTKIEIGLLYHLVKDKKTLAKSSLPLPKEIARLGGYLGRANDPRPGNMVMCGGDYCASPQQNLWVFESR
jgi:hypothetical protein